MPGLGVDSARQIIAEVGPTASTFPFEKNLSSWFGACPRDEESAGVSRPTVPLRAIARCSRILNQSSIVGSCPACVTIRPSGDCPSDRPTHLDHSASWGSLRGTRARLYKKVRSEHALLELIRQLHDLGCRVELLAETPTSAGVSTLFGTKRPAIEAGVHKVKCMPEAAPLGSSQVFAQGEFPFPQTAFQQQPRALCRLQ